ncbi:hypothetical protein CAPTEDRAFT_195449 [Capitella teleta]|uniref:Uncharacterized protein n=1 Tax=Capitella teleta TaxID=283909 RepID=R7TS90_CAPTE|nr:hypothetical protein CAPTEDRAFT_195449 [Capitella teleta]|eukprot:ELT93885.1 hypothetical protein CAPTEDRAFT_195449 [Capitella teleta]
MGTWTRLVDSRKPAKPDPGETEGGAIAYTPSAEEETRVPVLEANLYQSFAEVKGSLLSDHSDVHSLNLSPYLRVKRGTMPTLKDITGTASFNAQRPILLADNPVVCLL